MKVFDDDNFYVHIFEAVKSELRAKNLRGKQVYTMVIEIVTDDKEALDFARLGLSAWFKERGLTETRAKENKK